MDKLTCFFRKAFDSTRNVVWLEGQPDHRVVDKSFANTPREGQVGYVHRKGGPDDTEAGKVEAKVDTTKGGPPKVDAEKRAGDEKIAKGAGFLAMFEKTAADSPLGRALEEKGKKPTTLAGEVASLQKARQEFLSNVQIARGADKEDKANRGLLASKGTRNAAPGTNLNKLQPEKAGTRLASIQLGAPVVPMKEQELAVARATKPAIRAERMLAEQAAEQEYGHDKMLADATDLLKKETGPLGKKLETMDDSAIVKALIVAVSGEKGWKKFTDEYTEKSRAGELPNGKAIETFQRNWVRKNCAGGKQDQDLYADIAELKANLGMGATTIVEYTGIKGKGEANPEKPFDRLRYEMSRALGVTDQPLSGKDLLALYSDTPYVEKSAIARALTVKGAKINVSPEGQIYIRTPDNMTVALAKPTEQAVQAKLGELGRKKAK